MRSVEALLPAHPFRADAYLQAMQEHHVRTQGEVAFEKTLEAYEAYLEGEQRVGAKAEDDTFLLRKHQAMIGDPSARYAFLERIREFLRDRPMHRRTQYPTYYPSLEEAIFEHVYGFGPMSVWFRNPTESATVNGVDILFGVRGKNTKELQPFRYGSIEEVEKLVRTLTLKDPSTQVNQKHNWTQVDMLDGTRVTIFTPPLSESITVIFRQYLMHTYTFEEEARMGTIDPESVLWWKLLSRLMLSMLTTGHRRSGKTTFLKVIYGARDPNLDVLTVERGTFEAHLRRDFPERAAHIMALKSELDDMEALFPAFLRSDAHYILVPEIRSQEVHLAIQSRERADGWLGSYHGKYAENIPLELAHLLLEGKANLDFRSAYIRTAQSIDVVIAMRETAQGTKRVQAVYAYAYDPEREGFTVTPWMRDEGGRWTYYANIPPRLLERLQAEVEPSLLQGFQEEFQRLAETHPMTQPKVQRLSIGGGVR